MWSWVVVIEDVDGIRHEFNSSVVFVGQAECAFHLANHVAENGPIDQYFDGIGYMVIVMDIVMNLN